MRAKIVCALALIGFVFACTSRLSPKALLGSYSETLPPVMGVSQTVRLDLKEGGQALLKHDFGTGKSTSEFGLWEVEDDRVNVSIFVVDKVNFGKNKLAATLAFKVRDGGKRLLSAGAEGWDLLKQ